jgi:hypothetical protein
MARKAHDGATRAARHSNAEPKRER